MGRHRWAGWIESSEVEELLWKAKGELKTAFGWDNADAYPLNASYALQRTVENLSKLLRPQRVVPEWPRLSKIPKNLLELVPEPYIKAQWEEQHSGTYEAALKAAAQVDLRDTDKSWKIFQGIIHAMETAYMVHYWGIEFLSKPRVNILHKGLNRVAIIVGLGGLTAVGFAEFLDDLCPCGLTDHREAVRKLWRRSPEFRLSKSLGTNKHE